MIRRKKMSMETKKSTLIAQDFEWIGFDDFVADFKKTTSPPHWSGRFRGLPVTHENDSLYLVGFADNQVRFHKWDVLCILCESQRLFILQHPIAPFVSK